MSEEILHTHPDDGHHQPSASLQDKDNTGEQVEKAPLNIPDKCQTDDEKLCITMKQQLNIEAKNDEEDLEVDADVMSDTDVPKEEDATDVESKVKEEEKVGVIVEQQSVQQEVGDVKTESESQDVERQGDEQPVESHAGEVDRNVQIDEVDGTQPTQDPNVLAQQQEQQHQTENVIQVDQANQQQQVQQTQDLHKHQSQPVQEQQQDVRLTSVQNLPGLAQQQQQKHQPQPVQEQQQDVRPKSVQNPLGLSQQQKQQQQPQQQQHPCPSQTEEQKMKKKKKPFYKKRLKINKLGKSKKGKDKKDKGKAQNISSERTQEAEACVECVASVDVDGDDDIAKVHLRESSSSSSQETCSLSSTENILNDSNQTISQLVKDESHASAQASSANRDGQLVTGASVSSLEVLEESQEQSPAAVPKLAPPRLDTSTSVPVSSKAPVRHSPTSYHPTEQFYDVLMIHSDNNEDWKEVDFIKSVARRYGWKMISVEEFPAGMTKFQIFSTMLARCSYTMLLLTKNFFGDVWCNHRYAACLTAAIENREHQWSVIPVLYNDSGYETPLELSTIAGLQREARYFKKNLKSSISNKKRKEREEAMGFPSEPTPPPSPPPSPVEQPGATAKPEFKEDTSQMSVGELYRHLKPELTPTEPIMKFFRDDDRFRKICELLDQEHPLGRDYRLLAQMIGFNAGETRSLTKEKSPSVKILEVFCLKNQDKARLEVLETFKQMVTELDQQEVKSLVENEIMVARFAT